MELWRLVAHNHWFTISIFEYKLKLCARCSGYVTGMTFFIFTPILFGVNVSLWDQTSMVFTITTLSIPLIFDWMTQKWGLRNSSNQIRLVTGILMGYAVGIFSHLNLSLRAMKIYFIVVLVSVLLSGFLGSKLLKRLTNEYY